MDTVKEIIGAYLDEEIENHAVCDAEIRGGEPVFKGTRVPFATLFTYLAKGKTIDDFIYSFPSISKEKIIDVLKLSRKMYIKGLYEGVY
jgi:uncharacterized protein (DUF433 family)